MIEGVFVFAMFALNFAIYFHVLLQS